MENSIQVLWKKQLVEMSLIKWTFCLNSSFHDRNKTSETKDGNYVNYYNIYYYCTCIDDVSLSVIILASKCRFSFLVTMTEPKDDT